MGKRKVWKHSDRWPKLGRMASEIQNDSETKKVMSAALVSVKMLAATIESLREANPMLGLRGQVHRSLQSLLFLLEN